LPATKQLGAQQRFAVKIDCLVIYILWEFTVPESHLAAFERAYAGDGVWAGLFRRDPAYRETILVKDHTQSGRYLTIDVWEDKDSYLRFKDRFADEYKAIDKECERFTSAERQIGIFERLA
jgi:quinol monooxygenase YgiN